MSQSFEGFRNYNHFLFIYIMNDLCKFLSKKLVLRLFGFFFFVKQTKFLFIYYSKS
jgi:hypothetical protein